MGQVNADGEQGEAAFDLRPPVYPHSGLYSRVSGLCLRRRTEAKVS